MKEGDTNLEFDFWVNYVEQAFAEGEQSVSVPMFSMTEGVAEALATRLNVSLKTEKADYLFSRVQNLDNSSSQ